jgi:hypothetical protein
LVILSAQFIGSKKGIAGLMMCTILCAFLFSVFSSDSPKNPNIIYDKETDYYRIRVVDYDYFPGSGKNRWLFLDFDSHSIKTDKPVNLYTDMAPVFDVFSKISGHPMDSMHVIGAGAYVLPENMRILFPKAEISVSEIDPTLVDVGNDYFDLAHYDITTDIGDARVFFANKGTGTYDLVFGDAYNSFISVPWHLMTKEFIADVQKHITGGGLYAVNFTSSLEGDSSGLFRAEYATMNKAFPNNYVFAFGKTPTELQNITVIGVNGGVFIPTEDLRSGIEKTGNAFLSDALLSQARIDLIKQDISEVPILTDDFAPVERLMSPTMSDYFQPYSQLYNKIMN